MIEAVMNKMQVRLLLASLLIAFLSLVLACGGAGTKSAVGKPARTADERTAASEDEHNEDGLVLLKKTVRGTSNRFHIEIGGTVVNRRHKTLKYAQITFNVYDESGAQIDTALANINGLEPGGRWNFKAVALTGLGRRYKFAALSGR